MGLATAPSLMQTVMGAIARLVMARCPAVRARVYLDDFLFSAPSPDLLIAIPDLLRSWGLQMNVRKSQLLPCRQLTYLGLSLDLAERRLLSPSERGLKFSAPSALSPALVVTMLPSSLAT